MRAENCRMVPAQRANSKENQKGHAEFMAFGTTGSDAVNAELKAWFDRGVNIRSQILRLKLRIFRVCKLTAF